MENIQKEDTLQIEELLRRIEELEDGHAHLKQNIFNLMMSRDQQLSSRPRQSTVREGETASSSFQHCPPLRSGGAARNGGGVTRHSAVKLTEAQYFNILQSIDEPIHITDAKGFIIYRNRAWEKFYGYTAAEALGKDVIELMIGPMDAPIANNILQQILNGESHSGEFVVRNKKGEKFLSFGSSKPLRDENGTVIGIMGISPVPCPYQEISPKPNVGAPTRIASQQPLQSDLVIT